MKEKLFNALKECLKDENEIRVDSYEKQLDIPLLLFPIKRTLDSNNDKLKDFFLDLQNYNWNVSYQDNFEPTYEKIGYFEIDLWEDNCKNCENKYDGCECYCDLNNQMSYKYRIEINRYNDPCEDYFFTCNFIKLVNVFKYTYSGSSVPIEKYKKEYYENDEQERLKKEEQERKEKIERLKQRQKEIEEQLKELDEKY